MGITIFIYDRNSGNWRESSGRKVNFWYNLDSMLDNPPRLYIGMNSTFEGELKSSSELDTLRIFNSRIKENKLDLILDKSFLSTIPKRYLPEFENQKHNYPLFAVGNPKFRSSHSDKELSVNLDISVKCHTPCNSYELKNRLSPSFDLINPLGI